MKMLFIFMDKSELIVTLAMSLVVGSLFYQGTYTLWEKKGTNFSAKTETISVYKDK